MGPQDGGGPLKREIGTSDECFRCGIDLEEKGILCPECSKVNGRSFLVTGDLPQIMVFGLMILIFVMYNYGTGSAFSIPGTDIEGGEWGFLLLAVAGIFIIFQSAFNWRYLARKITYSTILRTISPTLVSIPVAYIFTFGITGAGITVSIILIVLFIMIMVFNRKMVLSSPRSDMILLLVSNLAMAAGAFASINGKSEFLSLESISMGAISAIGLIGVFFFSIRVNVNASILARRSMTYGWMLFMVIFMLLLILVDGSSIGIKDMALLWYIHLAFLAIGISFFTLKRTMDMALLRVYKEHSRVMKDLDEEVDLGHPNYVLNLLDSDIRNNPVHGMGDIPANGNLLFRMEGGEGDIQISKEPDEYVKAHWEKGRLLASTGKYKEALREFETATSKGSDQYRTYYHKANLRSVMPGESKKAYEDIEMYLASRRMYISRLIENGLRDDYLFLFSDLYDMYSRAIERKMEMLKDLGRSGDVSSYFTLSRED